MKKIILLVALAFVANVTKAQTVKDITTKYYEVIGGQNWEKVKNMQMFANIDNSGMKIPIEVVEPTSYGRELNILKNNIFL